MSNKVKFGLSNCYYSKITYSGGTEVFDAPVALPGAVNLSLDPVGDTSNFYADNGIYYALTANQGYSGSLELALIPDGFRTDILGETLNTSTGVYIETSNATLSEFALLFQFEGDEKATRHLMYRCVASRPSVASQTTNESAEPVTETLNLTSMPLISNMRVRGKVLEGESAYTTWFSAVYTS